MNYTRRFPRSFYGIASTAEFQAISGLKVGDIWAELRDTSVVISNSLLTRIELENAIASALQAQVCPYCQAQIVRGFSKVKATCFVQFCCPKASRTIKSKRVFYQGKELQIQENKAYGGGAASGEVRTSEVSYNGLEEYLAKVFGDVPAVRQMVESKDYFAQTTGNYYGLVVWHCESLEPDLPEHQIARSVQLRDLEDSCRKTAPTGIGLAFIVSPASGWMQILVQSEQPLDPETLHNIKPDIVATQPLESPRYYLWNGEYFKEISDTKAPGHRYVVTPAPEYAASETQLVAALFDTFPQTISVNFPQHTTPKIKNPLDLDGVQMRIECPGFAFDQAIPTQESDLIILTTSEEIEQGTYALQDRHIFNVRLMR